MTLPDNITSYVDDLLARIEQLEAKVARLSWLESCVQRAIDKGEYLGYGIDEAMDGAP